MDISTKIVRFEIHYSAGFTGRNLHPLLEGFNMFRESLLTVFHQMSGISIQLAAANFLAMSVLGAVTFEMIFMGRIATYV